jgi:TM2 domain-containing membrane protein YozV
MLINSSAIMENSNKEHWNNPQPVREDNKKLAAGILALLLAPLGIHKFLLGYTKEGIIWLVISLVTCGSVTTLLGFIEGIIYLTKSDDEFYQTYQVNRKSWF